MFGLTDIVKLLITKGANVNVQTEPQKYAPIHSASFGGHLDTIKVLVNNGADLNLKNYRDERAIERPENYQTECFGGKAINTYSFPPPLDFNPLDSLAMTTHVFEGASSAAL